MYMAQVFEHEVVNLLVLARVVRAQKNAERILSDPWERRFRDTLGGLFSLLKPFVAHDQQLMHDIEEGGASATSSRIHTGACMPKRRYP